MKVTNKGNICILKEFSFKEIEALNKLLSVKADNYWFSKAYKQGHWDGTYKFFNLKSKSFPSGFLPIILNKFPGVIVENDYPSYTCTAPRIKDSIQLRDYQLEAINKALTHHRGLLEVPTAGGKTAITAGICSAISANTLVIVPTRELLQQTARELHKFLQEPIGKIGAGYFNLERITVGIFKSVSTMEQEEIDYFQAVISDECHRSSCETLYEALLRFPVGFRIGMSADPLDQHRVKQNTNYKKARIIGCLGPTIYRIPTAQLQDKGVLAKANIKFIKVYDPHIITGSTMDYQNAYCAYHCDNTYLTEKVVELCKSNSDSSVLIIVKHIHHGKNLSDALLNEGFNFAFLSGEESPNFVSQRITDFNNGKFNILVGSPIFNEGVDMPGIDVLINAAGDVAATKQRLGRGLRQKKNKENKVEVFDFILSEDSYVAEHAIKRATIYKREGHDVTYI